MTSQYFSLITFAMFRTFQWKGSCLFVNFKIGSITLWIKTCYLFMMKRLLPIKQVLSLLPLKTPLNTQYMGIFDEVQISKCCHVTATYSLYWLNLAWLTCSLSLFFVTTSSPLFTLLIIQFSMNAPNIFLSIVILHVKGAWRSHST